MGTNDNTQSNSLKYGFLTALVIIAGLIAVLIYTNFSESKSKVTLNIGDNSVDIELDNSQMQAIEILKVLFQEENRKRETQALLKEFYDVYYVKDPQLVNELAAMNGSDQISKELRQLLKDLRGPFNRKFHKFYNIEDKSIINAIEQLGYEHPVSEALRELVVHAEGPFREVALPVRISVPAGNKISKGTGASCRSNHFFRKSVRIFDQTKTRSVDIIVDKPFDCPVSSAGDKSELIDLIQVSYEDIKELIGNSAVTKFEPGFAKVR